MTMLGECAPDTQRLCQSITSATPCHDLVGALSLDHLVGRGLNHTVALVRRRFEACAIDDPGYSPFGVATRLLPPSRGRRGPGAG